MKIKILILASAVVILFPIIVLSGDFYYNGDGTVTDYDTGLMWRQDEAAGFCYEGLADWEEAISCCERLTFGYTDWRLPNIKELESIIDDTIYNPAIDTTFFPDADAAVHWSSTTNAYDSSTALGVYFGSGIVTSYDKTSSRYVRCVRDGQ